MIPNCPGAVFDLWNNDNMTRILDHFVSEKSKLNICSEHTYIMLVLYPELC